MRKVTLQVNDDQYSMWTLLLPEDKVEYVKRTIQEMHDEFFREGLDNEWGGYWDYVDAWLNTQDYIEGHVLEELNLY